MKSSGSVYRRSRSARRQALDLSHHRQRGELLRQPHDTSWIQSGPTGKDGQRREKRICWKACAERSPSPTPRSPIESNESFLGGRAGRLWRQGAGQTQRLLWASRAEEPEIPRRNLRGRTIGADTVDTIPPATFDAFRDHGKLRKSLTEDSQAPRKPWTTWARPAFP